MVSLRKITLDFLNQHARQDKPILMGLSGGPDSLCLFHILMECRSEFSFPLHIAHIDHGWREESSFEAIFLERLASSKGLPFHLKRLNPNELQGNLESAFRDERLHFFYEICQKFQCQGVILAHHADDQAETVLKRIFEGASFPRLSGLQKVTQMQDLTLWRPFLNISKAEIVRWLDENKLEGFDDKTNRDPKYLRARFRTTIIPHLSELFGKEISGTLCRMADEATELRHYFDARLSPYEQKIAKGPFGSHLDLRMADPLSKVEFTYLFRKLCDIEHFAPSRAIIDTAFDLMQCGASNRHVATGKHRIWMDRQSLFIVKEGAEQQFLEDQQPLRVGESRWGEWNVSISSATCQDFIENTDWRRAWKGICDVILPEGEYKIGYPLKKGLYGDHSFLAKKWTNHKIPAFFRDKIPVIFKNDTVAHEFLTGLRMANPSNERKLRLTLLHEAYSP